MFLFVSLFLERFVSVCGPSLFSFIALSYLFSTPFRLLSFLSSISISLFLSLFPLETTSFHHSFHLSTTTFSLFLILFQQHLLIFILLSLSTVHFYFLSLQPLKSFSLSIPLLSFDLILSFLHLSQMKLFPFQSSWSFFIFSKSQGIHLV